MGLMTKAEYIESLRNLKPTVYMFGEKIENVVDNPRIRAGIESTGATYALAEDPEYRDLVGHPTSPLIGEPVNRFNLPPSSVEDLVARVKINRVLGRRVGTCHQRCTGMDCLCALSIVAYDIDQKYGTNYFPSVPPNSEIHAEKRLHGQRRRDRRQGRPVPAPHRPADKDVYLRVVEKRDDGIVVRGAKTHQTGSLSSHELIVLPTRALREGGQRNSPWPLPFPTDTKGIIHVVGRNSLDSRELDGCDCGNTSILQIRPHRHLQ